MLPSGHSQSPHSLFSRLREKWRGSLRFRHTFVLSGIILVIMMALASIMVSKQRAMLYHAAEAKGLAFTQAFAIGGWAESLSNPGSSDELSRRSGDCGGRPHRQ